MKKIIAIGGGEIGRPGYPVETNKIDREIIKLTGKKNPKLLFIPTASKDSITYIDVAKKHFEKRLGCEVNNLLLFSEKPSKKEIEKKILGSDIIYVGGGNTLLMMKTWRRLGVDKILEKAYNKGIVMSGLSAGSICWFRWGNSDSPRFSTGSMKLIKVRSLGFIRALNCPHYDIEQHRSESLMEMMKKTSGVAIALDNCAALEVIDDKYRIITSKPNAKAYVIFWKKNIFYKLEIKQDRQYKSLAQLLQK